MFGHVPEYVADQESLVRSINSVEKFVVYGAGNVAKTLLLYLKNNNYDMSKISEIMVSWQNGNPEYLYDIPVKCIEKADECSKKTVLVAISEKVQNEIVDNLYANGYTDVILVRNSLYNELVRENNYFYDAHLMPDQYEDALKKWYENKTGQKLDFNNLITYNEKIQWMKLYGPLEKMTLLTDKYKAREWIKEQIGEEYLIPLLGVWDCFDDIEIDKLPERFVLKCNHGCEWNDIVRDKSKWDVKKSKKKFDVWMKKNYAYCGGLQLQYQKIEPKIIAEEYMENVEGDLYDYKFWCFNGRVEFVMFLSERNKELRMNNYDREWNQLPFTYNYSNTKKYIPRPQKLEKMIALAEKLAKEFKHVRVDFYQLNDGTIKFGEMTFTSCNGECNWSEENINYALGSLMN